jgi:hypothetical protein
MNPSGAPGGLEAGRKFFEGETAAAVTVVFDPIERGSHAQRQHVELARSEGERGGAAAPSPVPLMRWMV